MPSPSTATHLRLNNITKQIVVSAETLEILASSLKTPLLTEISNTTNALLNVAQVRLDDHRSSWISFRLTRPSDKTRIDVHN
jgi:hypothetical protein